MLNLKMVDYGNINTRLSPIPGMRFAQSLFSPPYGYLIYEVAFGYMSMKNIELVAKLQ